MIYRTIDGSGNNIFLPVLNSSGSDFTRLGTPRFDGVTGLVDGPNPRDISNIVVGQGDADAPNTDGLSDFMYAWGQFIDHDLDLSLTDHVTHIDIPIPNGDPDLPSGAISMTRAVTNPLTGAPVNSITGWIDGSMVYGSTAEVAASLMGTGGHLLTSFGDNLPVVNGAFMAGDIRAAENPVLTSLQTMFLREHNYQVDRLAALHADWSDSHLYNEARAIVGAEIQHVTYEEFLPHLLGELTPYMGYDPTVDPTISVEFAGAAFRFGHSIVSDDTGRIDNLGAGGDEIDLKDAFFMTPAGFVEDGGADGFIRHLGTESHNAMDVRIVDALRNFLVDANAGAFQDLAAINIQRGRDIGLGTLNETREAIGLAPYVSFDQITDDTDTVAALTSAFGTVDDIDLWTGGLSERHAEGAVVGETFREIIGDQFAALRDGDQFWYENAGFDEATLREIKATSLSDIIERTTDTAYIQPDVFMTYARHSGELGGVEVDDDEGAGRELVIGSPGDDVLVGGDFDDILVPAAGGHQTLTGGEGADQFVITSAGINATITDFSEEQGDQIVYDLRDINIDMIA